MKNNFLFSFCHSLSHLFFQKICTDYFYVPDTAPLIEAIRDEQQQQKSCPYGMYYINDNKSYLENRTYFLWKPIFTMIFEQNSE